MSTIKSILRSAALASVLATALSAQALETVRFMAPGSPGGGYDQTARTLGKALQDAGAAKSVVYDNKNGAGGTLGLAQFVNGSKGDVNALCVMGAIMVTGIVQNKPQITLANATPIARLFTEYNVIAVRKDSPYKTFADLMADFKKNPGSVKWGGGSKGSVDHIGTAELAAADDELGHARRPAPHRPERWPVQLLRGQLLPGLRYSGYLPLALPDRWHCQVLRWPDHGPQHW